MSYFSQLIQQLEKENKIMSGAGQSIVAMAQMTHSIDDRRKPYMIALYDAISKDRYQLPRDIVEARHLFPGAIIQVGLQLPIQDIRALNDLGDGVMDQQIEAMVMAYKQLNSPVILRIGYEFEGPWNDYNPESYVKAYRRIVNAFRGQKSQLVSFCWNAYIGKEHEIDQWFPGEGYVDWLGYNVISDCFDGSWYLKKMSELEKPYLIGEASYAINDNHDTFEAWLDHFFDSMERSGIRGYQYINWDWHLYPSHMAWHTWENGLFTEDANKVAYFNGKLSKECYLFRDEHYHQPIRLFVDCARGLLEKERGNRPWTVKSDHVSHDSGYMYEFANAETVYGDGFSPYVQSIEDHLELSLHIPSGFEGYLILDLGTDPYHKENYSIWLEDQVYRVAVGRGYIKIPMRIQPPKKVLSISMIQSGHKIKLKQLGLLECSQSAKPIEILCYNYKTHTASWTAIPEAIGYNIYRNHELIGMVVENSFKCNQDKYQDRLSATAVYSHHGESKMTYLKV